MHIKSVATLTLLACSIASPNLSVAMEKLNTENTNNTSFKIGQPPTPQKPISSTKKEDAKPTPAPVPVIEDPKTIRSLEEIHKLNTTQRQPVSDKTFIKSVNKVTHDDASEFTQQEGKTELTHIIAFNNIRCHYSAMKNNTLSHRSRNRWGTISIASIFTILGCRKMPNLFLYNNKKENSQTPITVSTPETKDAEAPAVVEGKKTSVVDKKPGRWLIHLWDIGISTIGGVVLGTGIEFAVKYFNDEWSKSQKIENETKPWRDQSARINQIIQGLSSEDSSNILREANRLTEEYMKKYPTPIKLVQEDDNKVYVIRDGKRQDIKLNRLPQQ